MSCKRLSRAARAEQDYWLSYSDCPTATEAERLDFLRFDSHGGGLNDNPILLGKIRHGQAGEVLRAAYEDRHGGWVGGLGLVLDYGTRHSSRGIKSLVEWFGPKAVHRWLGAVFAGGAMTWD